MNQTRLLLIGIIIIGILLLGVGLYLVFNPTNSSQQNSSANISPTPAINAQSTSQVKTSTPNCVISYPAGSCWTISNPPQSKVFPQPSDDEFKSESVSVSGDSCIAIVPANDSNGVVTKGFTVNKGDLLEITATGTAVVMDTVRNDANGVSNWHDPYVDSPFSQNVGGLEFSIESLSKNRYFAGNYYKERVTESGELVFRVIERKTGYTDNNFGGFKVFVKKIK